MQLDDELCCLLIFYIAIQFIDTICYINNKKHNVTTGNK